MVASRAALHWALPQLGHEAPASAGTEEAAASGGGGSTKRDELAARLHAQRKAGLAALVAAGSGRRREGE